MRVVLLGQSLTSSSRSRYAETCRALLRALSRRGHDVLVLERDVPRSVPVDPRTAPAAPDPGCCDVRRYTSISDLMDCCSEAVRHADLVIVGACVPESIAAGEWVVRTAQGVTAFYDSDTAATLAQLDARACGHVSPSLLAAYQLYLSFTGGPGLDRIEHRYASPAARPLYCSFDAGTHGAVPGDAPVWDLGYAGPYTADRQAALDLLLTDVARRWGGGRFVVVGSPYPPHVRWPANVRHVERLPGDRYPAFHAAQRFTLSLAGRAAPDRDGTFDVRLLEAAACGTPVISDHRHDVDPLLQPGTEILMARSPRDVVAWLVDMSEADRIAIGERARQRVLREHTAAHRARELERYIADVRGVVPAAATLRPAVSLHDVTGRQSAGL